MNIEAAKKSKQYFSLINCLDFIYNQKFFYKKSDLTGYFLFLYNEFLNYLLDSRSQYFDAVTKSYLESKIQKYITDNNCTDLKSEDCTNKIRKHILFGNKIDYRYLLISEVIYSLNLFGISMDIELQRDLGKLFCIKEDSLLTLIEKSKNQQQIPDRKTVQSFSAFNNFSKSLEEYNSLRVVNIGVCATMSAGKSSFVNALLGYDYLPMRNEATTARITSVYDNDNARKMIGYTMKADNILSLNDSLDYKVVDEWNSDDNIDRIVLQGDLDNIGNNGIIVAVHDTPGTNNSGDENHHDITLDFLKNNKMDAIIFVANIEHLCTTDEAELLKELYEKVIESQNIPVIFVLNKADSVDTEKETLESVITHYKKYVNELGFTNSSFFPVSAKAARLLKMVIKNKSDSFSESECDIFPSIIRKFTKRLNLSEGEEIQKSFAEKMTVDGETYKKSELITALFHTGINRIEKEIEVIIKR